ncbi:MAG: TM2 domain-containing protein [Burkholderiales bacterium]|nr:TM2 domain-containing protein [Burkholderiales bacterium]
MSENAMIEESDKDGMLMALLCVLFGVFGAHRFYAGYKKPAVIQLCTFGGLGVWMIIDLLFILFGEFKDAEGRKVNPWHGM